jgi:hypothetical protein
MPSRPTGRWPAGPPHRRHQREERLTGRVGDVQQAGERSARVIAPAVSAPASRIALTSSVPSPPASAAPSRSSRRRSRSPRCWRGTARRAASRPARSRTRSSIAVFSRASTEPSRAGGGLRAAGRAAALRGRSQGLEGALAPRVLSARCRQTALAAAVRSTDCAAAGRTRARCGSAGLTPGQAQLRRARAAAMREAANVLRVAFTGRHRPWSGSAAAGRARGSAPRSRRGGAAPRGTGRHRGCSRARRDRSRRAG